MLVQVGLEPDAEHTAQTRPPGGQAWKKLGPATDGLLPAQLHLRPLTTPLPILGCSGLLQVVPGSLRDPQAPQGSWALNRAGRAPVTSLCWAGGPRPACHQLSIQKGDSKSGGYQLGTSRGETHTAPGPQGTRSGESWGMGGGGQTRALHQKGERWSWR